MSQKSLESSQWTTRQNRNARALARWTTAWVLSLALAQFGPRFLWDEATLLSSIGIALNLAIGIGMILANRRLIMDLDEMQRQVQLEAMAFALGIGLVFGLAYAMLDTVNLISFDARIPELAAFIALVFMASVFRGTRRLK